MVERTVQAEPAERVTAWRRDAFEQQAPTQDAVELLDVQLASGNGPAR